MVEYALLLASTSFGGFAGEFGALGGARELARPGLRAVRAGGASDRLLGLPLLGILRGGPWPAWSSISSRIPTGIGSGISRAPPSSPAWFPPSTTSSPASTTDPDFRSFFLDGQTVLLEDYLRVRPDQRARVASLVRAGRLEIGPWYVLADELVPRPRSSCGTCSSAAPTPSGSAAGRTCSTRPMRSGIPPIWPALAAEFGMAGGVLWRGLGGEPGQEGDLYRWHAPDGRADPAAPPAARRLRGRVAALVADPLRARRCVGAAAARARRPRRHAASRGHVGADHHAAPVRRSAGCAICSPRSSPRPTFGSPGSTSSSRAAGAPRPTAFPRCTGELRWSYGYTWTLQGVHATRAPLKRRHAEAELRLERVAEPLAALAAARGSATARPLLDETWRALVRSQFHDSIGGCTSDAVARRVAVRLDDVAQAAGEIARASLDALLGNAPDEARDHPDRTAPRLVLWNPVARPRAGGVVVADLTWFRRDVLVGPPGPRAPRDGEGAREVALAGAPTDRSESSRLAARGAHERLDAPRHYPDQDEVDVIRSPSAPRALGGLGFAVLEPVERSRAPLESGARAGPRSLDNGLVGADRGAATAP